MSTFNNVYKNKKVVITGNTGFKGSWLSIWLNELGAEVYGISNEIPTEPSNFKVSSLDKIIQYHEIDIRKYNDLSNFILKIKPDFIFHLAAQALVYSAYQDPLYTYETNVLGTINVMESLKKLKNKCTVVMITSDKCYENVEWIWGYKETDTLGGKDPYSSSKACAELAIYSYYNSFFSKKEYSNISICSARAGNVIGGGDWASNRIIPDAINSWYNETTLEIRSPRATRPWQHVLEPLSGYLHLGLKLFNNSSLSGESFNFGPTQDSNYSVEKLLNELSQNLENLKWVDKSKSAVFNEAGLLKLNCDKALSFINWKPNLNFEETIKFVSDWYIEFKLEGDNMYDFNVSQINNFIEIAQYNNLTWAS